MWEYSREIEIERVTGSWREKQKVSLGMCALAQREREAENPRGSPQGEWGWRQGRKGGSGLRTRLTDSSETLQEHLKLRIQSRAMPRAGPQA